MRKLFMVLFALAVLALAAVPSFVAAPAPADEELKILSPHWDGIKAEFGRAFEEHYKSTTGRSLRVTFLEQGATGEIRKFLKDRNAQQLQDKRIDPGENFGADVLFGGGVDILPDLAQQNILAPHELRPEQLALIPAQNAGQDLRDPQQRFHGACLSAFGIVYNERLVQRVGLPVPQAWEDLARPEYQGWVSCGNPVQSGSLHVTFELILQGRGWEQGWATAVRMCSNVRAFNEGGSSVPRDVSLGQAAAGPCIDFYASAPVRRQGAEHLKLVIPQGFSIATPDGIAILRNAPNAPAARAFVDFVLSEAGQRLWYQARGTPGGPLRYDLERLPVMPHIYTLGLPTHTVINPFTETPSFRYDSRKAGARWSALNDLLSAAVIDVHGALWDARTAIRAAQREDLDALLGRAPFSEAELTELSAAAGDDTQRKALRNAWSGWARAHYSALAQAARSGAPAPAFTPFKPSGAP